MDERDASHDPPSLDRETSATVDGCPSGSPVHPLGVWETPRENLERRVGELLEEKALLLCDLKTAASRIARQGDYILQVDEHVKAFHSYMLGDNGNDARDQARVGNLKRAIADTRGIIASRDPFCTPAELAIVTNAIMSRSVHVKANTLTLVHSLYSTLGIPQTCEDKDSGNPGAATSSQQANSDEVKLKDGDHVQRLGATDVSSGIGADLKDPHSGASTNEGEREQQHNGPMASTKIALKLQEKPF